MDDSKYRKKPDRKKQQIMAKLAKIPYFANIPVVFTIPEPFAIREPMKMRAEFEVQAERIKSGEIEYISWEEADA